VASAHKSSDSVFCLARLLRSFVTRTQAPKPAVVRHRPPDREDEEPAILQRIRSGEHVDHYETIRRRKDGSFIDISLTVSPLRDATGKVVGASKVARDITARKRAAEQRDLLTKEMGHRVKNCFAIQEPRDA